MVIYFQSIQIKFWNQQFSKSVKSFSTRSAQEICVGSVCNNLTSGDKWAVNSPPSVAQGCRYCVPCSLHLSPVISPIFNWQETWGIWYVMLQLHAMVESCQRLCGWNKIHYNLYNIKFVSKYILCLRHFLISVVKENL